MKTSIDRSRTVGLTLFLIAVVWAVAWGLIGGLIAGSAMNSLTPAELAESVWAVDGPLLAVWGLSPAVAALVAGIGVLIYSKAKTSTVWAFGLGVSAALAIAMVASQGNYYPRLFGIGGAVILLSFFGILWFWAKDRASLKGSSAMAKDLGLVGYSFLLMATWFTCGIASVPFLEALEGQDPANPIHVITLFALGWVFLLLSHYTQQRQRMLDVELAAKEVAGLDSDVLEKPTSVSG